MAGGSNTLMADANDRLRAGDVAAESYPFLTTGLDGKALALINTDGNYKYVGRLVVDFDADGTLIPSSIDPVISGVYAADSQGLNDVWGANVANAYAVGTRGYQVQLLCNAVENVINSKDLSLIDCDITNETSIRIMIDKILQKYEKIDGLVNNAYPRTTDWSDKFENIKYASWKSNVDMQMNSIFLLY